MDGSVFNAVRSEGVKGLENMIRLSRGECPSTHTHTCCKWRTTSRMIPGTMASPHVFPMDTSHGVFVDLWVCMRPYVCAFHAKQPGSGCACELVADLVLKRMHASVFVRACKSVDQKWWKTYWRLGKIKRDSVCLWHTHRMTLKQTDQESAQMWCLLVRTTDWGKYLQPIRLLVSTPRQNLTGASKCYKTSSQMLTWAALKRHSYGWNVFKRIINNRFSSSTVLFLTNIQQLQALISSEDFPNGSAFRVTHSSCRILVDRM